MTVIAGSDERRQAEPSYTVSGFFLQEESIEAALWECLRRGVPRDLIDVAVSEAASRRFYGGRTRHLRDSWFASAGRGALAGLLISALATLAIVLVPGFETPEPMAIVQFLGPDIGVILGGAIGGLYGWMKPADPAPPLYRALARDDAALMLVHLQPQGEAEAIRDLLQRHGAQDVELRPATSGSVGSE